MPAPHSDVLRAFLETGSDLSDPRNRVVVQRENATSPTNVRNRRFIAECGTTFQPAERAYPARAMSGTCFTTALDLAIQNDRWAYIEGYALVNQGFLGTEPFGYAIHHAWTVDPNGVLFDPVYREQGAAYIGVAFNHAYVTQRHRHFQEVGRGSALLDEQAFDPNSEGWRHPSILSRQRLQAEGVMRRKWIAENAYFRWEAEGRPHGHDLDHWLSAEVEFAGSHGVGSPANQPRPGGD